MTTTKPMGRVALMAAASVLALSTAAGADTIRFWTTEEQPERLERQQAMAADFTAETGIEVEVIPVTESDLGTRGHGGFRGRRPARRDLPHAAIRAAMVRRGHPRRRGGDRSDREPRDGHPSPPARSTWLRWMRATPPVPVDGWTQMIVYRADLFEEKRAGASDELCERAGRDRGVAQPAGDVRIRCRDQGGRELHEPGAGTRVPRQWRLAGGSRRVPAARGRPDGRGSGLLQGDRRGQPRGGAVLATVARALFRGTRGDDHLVALHPRRTRGPARRRAADDQ